MQMQCVDLNAYLIESLNSKPDLRHLQIKRRVTTSVIPESDSTVIAGRNLPKILQQPFYDQGGIQRRIQRRKLSANETKRSLAGALTHLQVF